LSLTRSSDSGCLDTRMVEGADAGAVD